MHAIRIANKEKMLNMVCSVCSDLYWAARVWSRKLKRKSSFGSNRFHVFSIATIVVLKWSPFTLIPADPHPNLFEFIKINAFLFSVSHQRLQLRHLACKYTPPMFMRSRSRGLLFAI